MAEILEVLDVKKYFKTRMGVVKAVDGVSFSVEEGETFGLVGESGSGKTTIANMVVGVYRPTSGDIKYKGESIAKLISERPKWLKKEIQMVFQNPASSLNPRRTVKQILELPILIHRPGEPVKRILEELMDKVDLPTDFLDRYPEELGGGEKQLVAIARALAAEPSFIVLDEPTSSLDVSIQGKIINVLMKLKRELGVTYLFITHNLSLMSNVADRVAIMYLGKIKEIARAEEFFRNPLHPYTNLLLSSIPVMTDEEEKLKPPKTLNVGELAGALNIPKGCSFHPRCPYAQEVCKSVDPPLTEVSQGHYTACHFTSVFLTNKLKSVQ